MRFEISLVRGWGLDTLLTVLVTVTNSTLFVGCCGNEDPLEVQMDRERIDGTYRLSEADDMPISLPADAAGVVRTVEAQDVTLSIEGSKATVRFNVEGKLYVYTFNIQEKPFESHVFP